MADPSRTMAGDSPRPADSRRRALIIAAEHFEDPELPDLVAPRADADALSRVLGDPQRGNFEVEMAIDCDERELSRRIFRFFRQSGSSDVLLVYYSGHGLRENTADQNLYYAAADTRLEEIGLSAVSNDFLLRQMQLSPARQSLLVLDCCHAGAFSKGFRGHNQPFHSEDFEGRGQSVITAATAVQLARDAGRDVKGKAKAPTSPFTAAFVEGLETGMADRDGDGLILLQDAFAYVENRLREQNVPQTPRLHNLNMEGNLLLARVPPPPFRTPDAMIAAVKGDKWDQLRAVNELRAWLTGPDRGRNNSAERLLRGMLASPDEAVAGAVRGVLYGAPGTTRPAAIEWTSRRLPLWYVDAVFYDVVVESFADANGDGHGDLSGLINRLDYIQWLGLDCLLIESLLDADNPYGVREVLGNIGDCRRLCQEAHARGLRVVMDLDHTVLTQPKIDASTSSSREQSKHLLFHWLDAGLDGVRIVGPQLDGESLSEMHTTIRSLLDSVEMRYNRRDAEVVDEAMVLPSGMEVIPPAMKLDRILIWDLDQPGLVPQVPEAVGSPGPVCHVIGHYPFARQLLAALDSGTRQSLVEMYAGTEDLPEDRQWRTFLGSKRPLSLAGLPPEEKAKLLSVYSPDPMMFSPAANGIKRRLASLVDNDRRKLGLLYGLLLSLPGSPTLYAGDEIGMSENKYMPDEQCLCSPMQWNPDRNGGFSSASPAALWTPLNAELVYGYAVTNVEAQLSSRGSLLHWVRRLLQARNIHTALSRGSYTDLRGSNPKVMAFVRVGEEDAVICVNNLSGYHQATELDLAKWEGIRPVEALGRGAFPWIGSLPYNVTLAPYDVLWLQLEVPIEAPSHHLERSDETLNPT